MAELLAPPRPGAATSSRARLRAASGGAGARVDADAIRWRC